MKNPHSHAREAAAQYLYQCEREKIFYFAEGSFSTFVDHFAILESSRSYLRVLVEGVLQQRLEIDELLANASDNWKIERMGATDRSVLRIAVYELLANEEPKKVVMNEAIEVAKKFGSEFSAKFVNGVLDKIAHTLKV